MLFLFGVGQLALALLGLSPAFLQLRLVVPHQLVLSGAVLLELSQEVHLVAKFFDVLLVKLLLVLVLVFVELQFFNDALLSVDGVQVPLYLAFVECQLQSDGSLVVFELPFSFQMLSLPALYQLVFVS